LIGQQSLAQNPPQLDATRVHFTWAKRRVWMIKIMRPKQASGQREWLAQPSAAAAAAAAATPEASPGHRRATLIPTLFLLSLLAYAAIELLLLLMGL